MKTLFGIASTLHIMAGIALAIIAPDNSPEVALALFSIVAAVGTIIYHLSGDG
jgi:hypothetical protein